MSHFDEAVQAAVEADDKGTGYERVKWMLRAALPSLRKMWAEEPVEGKWRAVEGNPGTGWWLESQADGVWRSHIRALDEPTARRYANALNRADQEAK